MSKRFLIGSAVIIGLAIGLNTITKITPTEAGGGGTAAAPQPMSSKDADEGITASMPVPKDCEHVVLDVKFTDVGPRERHTEVSAVCMDGNVTFNKGYKVSFGLNHDPRGNPDMNGVVKLVFKDVPPTSALSVPSTPPQGI